VVRFTPWSPGRFTASTYWIRGSLGPKTVWTRWRKEAHHRPCRKMNPGRPAPSLVSTVTVRKLKEWCTLQQRVFILQSGIIRNYEPTRNEFEEINIE